MVRAGRIPPLIILFLDLANLVETSLEEIEDFLLNMDGPCLGEPWRNCEGVENFVATSEDEPGVLMLQHEQVADWTTSLRHSQQLREVLELLDNFLARQSMSGREGSGISVDRFSLTKRLMPIAIVSQCHVPP